MQNDIFKNKQQWNTFSTSELEQYKEDVFQYYRNKGFPYYSTDYNDRVHEYNKLVRYDYNKVLDVENKIIRQTMHGLNLAWSYMPHAYEVQCNSMKTVHEVFHNDDDFRKVIDKRIKHGDNISDSGIRKTLKIFTGTQCVSNFRPTAAAAIYSHFCKPQGTVWDISSGYAGRVLGAHLAGMKYYGTEPCLASYNGIQELIADFSIQAEVFNCGSEEFEPPEMMDFIFTSPPYFDTEKYSTEPSQSYIKFSTKEQWLNLYLKKTFEIAYNALKDGCHMAINIANVKSFPDLEECTVRVAQEVGFELTDTWKLALSSINSTGFKYEPIFIFTKGV